MKFKKGKFDLVWLLAVVVLSITACGQLAPSEPTQDPNLVFTQVAETVMVSMTQTAESMPPTPTPEPTATPQPTPTIEPTEAIPQPTLPAAPTVTIQRVGDAAKWNTQTPMDGKVFKPGEQFTFHVCLGNIGTTTWELPEEGGNKYYLEWVSGNRLWSDTKFFYVEDIVKPGGTWCFDLPSVAPYNPGNYITRWYFKNPAGQFLEEVYFIYKVEE